ncbi:MAG: flagellar basal body-associated FliL family protein [Thermodesulfobacteriota bacterium]|nr:flagellar basal body-associated FliL family protein [Thermodesulfobacteriota bacterium]
MSNKILLILIGVILLIVIAMGGGFFMMWSKMSSMNVVNSEEADNEIEEVVETMGPTKKLETFIVNLGDKGGKRYLRVSMDLELENGESAKVVDKRLPKLRDAVLMILPTKKYEDIGTVQGKSALRNEILTKLNELMEPEAIKNIYFTEFVVQ